MVVADDLIRQSEAVHYLKCTSRNTVSKTSGLGRPLLEYSDFQSTS